MSYVQMGKEEKAVKKLHKMSRLIHNQTLDNYEEGERKPEDESK